jgi:hypothetical protein
MAGKEFFSFDSSAKKQPNDFEAIEGGETSKELLYVLARPDDRAFGFNVAVLGCSSRTRKEFLSRQLRERMQAAILLF